MEFASAQRKMVMLHTPPVHKVVPYLRTHADGPCLVGTTCDECAYHTFPPSMVCPNCMSLEVSELPLSRSGVLYSFTTIRHAKAEIFGGYVDFPEQVRVFGHLSGFDQQKLPRCGLRVLVSGAIPNADIPGAPIDFVFVAESKQEGGAR